MGKDKKKRRGKSVFPHMTYFGAKAVKAVLDYHLSDGEWPSEKEEKILRAVRNELEKHLEASEDRHQKWLARNKPKVQTELEKLVAEQNADMEETGHGLPDDEE